MNPSPPPISNSPPTHCNIYYVIYIKFCTVFNMEITQEGFVYHHINQPNDLHLYFIDYPEIFDEVYKMYNKKCKII